MEHGGARQQIRAKGDLMAAIEKGELIRIEGLSFSFPERPICSELSFSLQQGESLVVLGSSGVGKSTLLRILGGLIPPDSGVLTLPPGEDIRMVFQQPRLFPWLSAQENLFFALRAAGVPEEAWEARVIPLLEKVCLAAERHRRISELSYGMAQRIALIRGVCCQPSLLLLDEPFSALDPKRRHELQRELLDFQATLSLSIVLVTHDIEEALLLADELLLLGERGAYKKLRSKGMARSEVDAIVRAWLM
jgi:ABC-type nitrate/sulfonate/bicarbonate transport system ATPase subunit